METVATAVNGSVGILSSWFSAPVMMPMKKVPLQLTLEVRDLLAVIVFFLTLVFWSMRNNKQDKSCDSSLPLPPGTMGWPLIGETINFFINGETFFKERVQRYGCVFKTHLLGRPTVRVVGAHNVHRILSGEGTLVTTQWPVSFRILMGEGTVAHSQGATHKARRKALQHAFTHRALQAYLPVMQREVRKAICRWGKTPIIRGFEEAKALTFASVLRVLVGFRMDAAEERSMYLTFSELVENLFCLPVRLPGSGLSKGLRARETLLKKIGEALTKKEACLDEPDLVPDALAQIMRSEEGKTLTRLQLSEMVIELLIAGNLSSASTMGSLMTLLPKNPHVIQKTLEELQEHGLQNPGDLDPDMTLATLDRLTYVGNVVKEVLRVAPPIGGGFRKALKTFELDGYQIPKGWTVAYSIRETQYFADVFEEGEKFNPDRWQRPLSEGGHFLPFGGGSRSCVGRELARMLLRVFVVELVRGCTWSLQNPGARSRYIPVPHAVDGLLLQVTPRPPGSSKSATQRKVGSGA